MKHSEIPIESIRPRIENTGTTAQKHAYNSDWLMRRPRCLGFGPEPVPGPSEEFSNYADQAISWPFVDGDQVTSEPMYDIWVSTFGESSLVEVKCDFAAFHLVDDEFYPEDEIEDIRDKAAQCAWTVDVTAFQLTDGDATWSAATELDEDSQQVVTDCWPTNHSATFWLLQQQRWLKYGDTATDYAFVFKEGQLHKSDWIFFTTASFTLDLGASHDIDIPTRFRVQAKRDTTFAPVYQIGSRTNRQDPEYLRLAMMSVSVWEFPL